MDVEGHGTGGVPEDGVRMGRAIVEELGSGDGCGFCAFGLC